MKKKKLNRLHYNYIILILTLSLIGVFTSISYNNTELVRYIGFATSIGSLILSVLAIFIIVISKDSANALIYKIRDLYDKLSCFPSSITDSVNKIKNISDNLENSSKSIKSIEENASKIENCINSQLNKLEFRIENLGKLEDLNKIVNDLNVYNSSLNLQLDKLKTINKQIESATKKNKKDIYNCDIQRKENNIDSLVESSSAVALILLYVLSKSYIKEKIIDIDKLSNKLEFIDSDIKFLNAYFYGYLNCIRSLSDFFDIQPKDNIETFLYEVRYINPRVMDSVETKITEDISNRKSTFYLSWISTDYLDNVIEDFDGIEDIIQW